MKRVFFITLILIILGNFTIYGLGTDLLDMRNEIFQESKEIKPLLLTNSKDVILLNSMWDSCIMVIMQIDAYFSMIGIVNTIKEENLNEISVNYLIGWLNEIKKTNELNIRSLDSVPQEVAVSTRLRVQKLKVCLKELNELIAGESKNVLLMRNAIKLKKE